LSFFVTIDIQIISRQRRIRLPPSPRLWRRSRRKIFGM